MLDPQSRRGPIDSAAAYHTHSRTRTTSSSVFPSPTTSLPPQQYRQYRQQPPPQQQQQQPQQQQQYQFERLHHYQPPQQQRQQQRPKSYQPFAAPDRSSTMNTFSTSSTGGPMPHPHHAGYHSPTMDIRRSSSSRSGDQPTGYVAALRRQKGTVWCDRAQPEDPAMAAQLRAAKMRATRTMAAGSNRLNTGSRNNSRTGTGISTTGKVAAKIRHHGKPAVVGYRPGENHVGVGGVPPRLSATEVEGESTDDEDRGHSHHRRTGSSGRSSTGSGRRPIPYRTSGPPGSQRGTPSRQGSLAESVAERPTPLVVVGAPSDAASGRAQSIKEEEGGAPSVKSGSSAERGDNVGDLEGDPAVASNSRLAAGTAKDKGGLERRGSVDERTMTLSAGRLFIANPD